MSTIREQIITAIVNKLADITVGNGYYTDIGSKVERVRPVFQPGELPAISVIPGAETAEKICRKVLCKMLITVEGYMLHGAINPSLVVEKMLGDMISCLIDRERKVNFTNGGTHVLIANERVLGATSKANALVVGMTGVQGSWAAKTATGTLRLKRQIGDFQSENLHISPVVGGIILNGATIAGNSTQFVWIRDIVEDISYAEGGPKTYPDSGQEITGCYATFMIKYYTIPGNPAAQ